jgi:hypothetical protein
LSRIKCKVFKSSSRTKVLLAIRFPRTFRSEIAFFRGNLGGFVMPAVKPAKVSPLSSRLWHGICFITRRSSGWTQLVRELARNKFPGQIRTAFQQ